MDPSGNAHPALCLWQAWNFLDETAKDEAECAETEQRRCGISPAHDAPIFMRYRDYTSQRGCSSGRRLCVCQDMHNKNSVNYSVEVMQ